GESERSRSAEEPEYVSLLTYHLQNRLNGGIRAFSGRQRRNVYADGRVEWRRERLSGCSRSRNPSHRLVTSLNQGRAKAATPSVGAVGEQLHPNIAEVAPG